MGTAGCFVEGKGTGAGGWPLISI